jgi:hypothetical protein
MRNKTMLIVVVLIILAFGVGRLSAGPPNSPSGPGATASYTLEDIYNRLNDGTAGSQTTFTGPSSAPGTGNMPSVNEIMAQAPEADTNGVTPAQVLTGKTFWGLTSEQWGVKTGTMPDNEGDNPSTAQSASGGVNTFTAPEGYYDGDDTVTATDAQVAALNTDITAGNIKNGVTIFGQAGDLHDSCTCTCAKCSLNGTRWCDNGNGTVTDLTTCLVWLKKADWVGQKVWLDCDSHDDAHTAAGTLCPTNCPGLSDGSDVGDWRLPTRTELRALTHGTEPVTWGTPRAFTGIQLDDYWTSTTTTAYPSPLTSAWCVSLVDGSYMYNSTSKTNSRWVWPVRDGQ